MQILGPAAAVECGIAIKLVSALQGVVISMMMMPYWPAYAGATAAKSASGVRVILWHCIGVSLLVSIPASLLIAFAGNDIIRLWISPDAIVNQSLLNAVGFFVLIPALTAIEWRLYLWRAAKTGELSIPVQR
jgi:O-antigen/teichoic acid export membrane protein